MNKERAHDLAAMFELAANRQTNIIDEPFDCVTLNLMPSTCAELAEVLRRSIDLKLVDYLWNDEPQMALTISELVGIARVESQCWLNDGQGRFLFDRKKLAAAGVTEDKIAKVEEFLHRYEELDAEVRLADQTEEQPC